VLIKIISRISDFFNTAGIVLQKISLYKKNASFHDKGFRSHFISELSFYSFKFSAITLNISTKLFHHDRICNYTLHSHSIVAGGLLVISNTTLPTPSTEFTMRFEANSNTSKGILDQSAVIPSTLSTDLRART